MIESGKPISERYRYLTREERCRLYGLKEAGFAISKIATILNRHRSTIYREFKRNGGDWWGKYRYFPNIAEKRYLKRRRRGLTLQKDRELKATVKKLLKKSWSPEQIAGRLKKDNKDKAVISHETIYANIYDERLRHERLYVYLRRKQRYRQPFASRKKHGPIPNRRDISERPKVVNTREEFGHWEGDLMLFRNTKNNLITLRERKSRYMLALLNSSKGAENTAIGITKPFKVKKALLIKSLTLDNGPEFSKHEAVAKALKIDVFFCKPYCSWQKGCVENGNLQLREKLPRDIPLNQYSQRRINRIVDRINHRPLKCLNYQTPAEVFQTAIA